MKKYFEKLPVTQNARLNKECVRVERNLHKFMTTF